MKNISEKTLKNAALHSGMGVVFSGQFDLGGYDEEGFLNAYVNETLDKSLIPTCSYEYDNGCREFVRDEIEEIAGVVLDFYEKIEAMKAENRTYTLAELREENKSAFRIAVAYARKCGADEELDGFKSSIHELVYNLPETIQRAHYVYGGDRREPEVFLNDLLAWNPMTREEASMNLWIKYAEYWKPMIERHWEDMRTSDVIEFSAQRNMLFDSEGNRIN